MRKVRLFEWEDFPWCPKILRDGATSYIGFAVIFSGQAKAMATLLRQVLQQVGSTTVTDLCSGGAGPMPRIMQILKKEGVDVQVTLSDKYPNATAATRVRQLAQKLNLPKMKYRPDSVDALTVGNLGHELGVLTLFNAFHHFSPADARRILQSAVKARAPIAIFEIVGRDPAHIISVLVATLGVFVAVPLLRPFRWPLLVLTYVIPMLPALVLWDGLVSCLRVYSEREMQKLAGSIDSNGFTWTTGRMRLGWQPTWGSYLIGIPSSNDQRKGSTN